MPACRCSSKSSQFVLIPRIDGRTIHAHVRHARKDTKSIENCVLVARIYVIDEFRILWLPWATHRKVSHKMAVWMATQRGWPSERPFWAIVFYASPRVTKECETRHKKNIKKCCPINPRCVAVKLKKMFWTLEIPAWAVLKFGEFSSLIVLRQSVLRSPISPGCMVSKIQWQPCWLAA